MKESKRIQKDVSYKIPTKREEVVMDSIWKVFNDANEFEVMLSIDEMKEIEQILFDYKTNTK